VSPPATDQGAGVAKQTPSAFSPGKVELKFPDAAKYPPGAKAYKVKAFDEAKVANNKHPSSCYCKVLCAASLPDGTSCSQAVTVYFDLTPEKLQQEELSVLLLLASPCEHEAAAPLSTFTQYVPLLSLASSSFFFKRP
jgi:hypothetical protein